jgi:hypothetical protein
VGGGIGTGARCAHCGSTGNPAGASRLNEKNGSRMVEISGSARVLPSMHAMPPQPTGLNFHLPR